MNNSYVADSSLFEKPQRIVSPYSWIGHLPFAFYLVKHLRPKIIVELGTHSGNSYFGFCQAVKSNNLNTKCYAVDTWKGDNHAGYYDNTVYNNVEKYNSNNYSNFSTLIRTTFTKAKDKFKDGQIDLLHIDGLHTYNAVKKDFTEWKEKLSESAIVLFHDISVKKTDFGVWIFWEEIKNKYTTLEFSHSHGLGVLFYGSKINYNFIFDLFVEYFTEEKKTLVKSISESYINKGVSKKIPKNNSKIKLYFKQKKDKNFSEENTLSTNIDITKTSYYFNISNLQTIEKLRIDPADTYCIISVLKIQAISLKGEELSLTYKANKQAIAENGKLYFINTDPQLLIETPSSDNNFSSVRIDIFFHALGVDALKEFIDLMDKESDKQKKESKKLEDFLIETEKKIESHQAELLETINRNQDNISNSVNSLLQEDNFIIANDQLIKLVKELKDYSIKLKSDIKSLINSEFLVFQGEINDRYTTENQILGLEIKGKVDGLLIEQEKQREVFQRKLGNKIENLFNILNIISERIISSELNTVESNSITIKKVEKLNKKIDEMSDRQLIKDEKHTILRLIEKQSSFLSKIKLFFNKEYRIISESPLFDEKYYQKQLISNQEVSRKIAILHYIKFGWQDNLNPSQDFSTKAYYKLNPDVAQAKINPLYHFCTFGYKEERKISNCPGEKPLLLNKFIFDPTFYSNTNKINGSLRKITNHWLTIGILLGKPSSPVFQYDYYRKKLSKKTNKNEITKRELIQVYLNVDIFNGVSASKDFNPHEYTENYQDIKDDYKTD